MIKTIQKILKRVKARNSRIKQLQETNEVLQAKIKTAHHDMVQSYLNGHSQTWTMVQVCLYDMYKNYELVHYGSLITEMSKRLENYDKDNVLRAEKLKQFDDDSLVRQKLIGEMENDGAVNNNDN